MMMIKVICYSYSITVDNFERCRSFCLFAFSTFCLAILTFWHFATLPFCLFATLPFCLFDILTFCHGPTTGDWRPGGRRRGARQRGVLRSCHATVDYGDHDDGDDGDDDWGCCWTILILIRNDVDVEDIFENQFQILILPNLLMAHTK